MEDGEELSSDGEGVIFAREGGGGGGGRGGAGGAAFRSTPAASLRRSFLGVAAEGGDSPEEEDSGSGGEGAPEPTLRPGMEHTPEPGSGPGLWGSDGWGALADAMLPPGRPPPGPPGARVIPPPRTSAALESARFELRRAAWERASLVLSELRAVGTTSSSGRNAFMDALVDFLGVHEGLQKRDQDLDLVQAGLNFEEQHYTETLNRVRNLVEAAALNGEDTALVERARGIIEGSEGEPKEDSSQPSVVE